MDDIKKLHKLQQKIVTLRKKRKLYEDIHKEFFDNNILKDYSAYYFFNQCPKMYSWHDLLKIKYDKPAIIYPSIINYSNKLISRYHKNYISMMDIRREYWIYYKRYCKINNSLLEKSVKEVNKITNNVMRIRLSSVAKNVFQKIKYSPGTKFPSSGEIIVKRFLDKIAIKYDFYYFYQYRWDFCRDKLPLEFDFYCFLIYEGKVIQFVIEYDGDQHYDNLSMFDYEYIHRHDILKQYYLFQMNIHLLRINNGHNVNKTIVNFINEVLTSKRYVIHNPITPISHLFQDMNKHDGLADFNKYYKKMYSPINKLRKIKSIKAVTNLLSVKVIESIVLDNDEKIVIDDDDIKRVPIKQKNIIKNKIESSDDEILDIIYDSDDNDDIGIDKDKKFLNTDPLPIVPQPVKKKVTSLIDFLENVYELHYFDIMNVEQIQNELC